MKALTVKQPWASLIALGLKRVENRTWAPNLEPGDEFLIHAGASIDKAAPAEFQDPELPRSAIVARVRFLGLGEPGECEFSCGPVCWRLELVGAFAEPIPAKGALGLWRVPDENILQKSLTLAAS
jgi:hypothetical protein